MYNYEYPRAAITADIIVFLKEKESYKILLIKRAREPFKNTWALPGGFMDIDETIETTATRELEEETTLKNIELKQLYTFSKVNRDPRHRTVSVVFYGFTDKNNCNIIGSDDASDAKWYNISNLPKLAFDHKNIINFAIEKLITKKLD